MILIRRFCVKRIRNFISSCRGHTRSMSTNNSSKPILYGDEASPPVRFALMTASVLNISLEFHKIDLFKAENKSEFYKKINPLQKVPALAIDRGIICDSHAIALYFCRMSKSNEMYPEDIFLRSKIDEMLYYNCCVLFPIDSDVFTDFFAGKGSANHLKVTKWYSALDYLELKLNKHKFLADDTMRLCDLCCGASVSSLEILIPLSERHEKLHDWLKNLKCHPCFSINSRGLTRLQSFANLINI